MDELRAARRKDGGAEDRPPAKGRARKVKAPPVQAPPYRPGVIQEGMNRLYRKTGKIVKAMDRDIGIAIIESTHDDEDGTGSVGWAWDQLAKTNPRIRAFLLKTMQGGAWGALITAHAPIFMAIIMKDGIRKHIPFMRLLGAWAEPDEDSAPGEGGLPGGMTMADMQSMMTMAQNLMGQTGVTVPPRRTPPESPEVA